jgi:type IV pilus assembly protein PilW
MLTAGRSQTGATLIELLVGLALSMMVTSSMVVLMSNSLGSATRIIQMTQLTDDMRNAMSMVSRDIRRANYSANSMYCYSNSDCGVDGSANQTAAVIQANCVIFNLDRNQDGDATTDDAGGFRRVLDNGVGVIEMWVGDSSAACNDASGGDWIPLTDPDLVNFTAFDFTLNDITGSVVDENGATLTQHTREISMVIAAELVIDPTVTRRIEDSIKVRNDFLEVTGP